MFSIPPAARSRSRRRALGALAALSSVALVGAVASRALEARVTQGPPPRQTVPAERNELHLTFLHTSDEHGALSPAPFVEYRRGEADRTVGGFARLATAVSEERARRDNEGEPLLLTSAGDNIGGTPYSWLLLDGEAPELTVMRDIGYDVVTIGNHEFDYGSEVLASSHARAQLTTGDGARPAIVATNIRPPDGHALGAAIRRTHVIALPNGLRVGFIGLIGEGAQRFAPRAAPVTFLDARQAAAEAERELRASGVHVVVAVTHSGLREDRQLARDVPGIDVILGGHDHRLIEAPVLEGRTIIIHPGSDLEQLYRLRLAVDTIARSVRVRNGETGDPFLIPLASRVAESPGVLVSIDAYTSLLEERIAGWTGGRVTSLSQVVATRDVPLRAGPPRSESELGSFVADAMRMAAQRATGRRVDVAVQAAGQLRGDVIPGGSDFNRAAISAYDLAGAVGLGSGNDSLPGYPMVSVYLTGDELRRVLELSVLLSEMLGGSYYLHLSGLRMEYNPARATWGRIPFRGTPIPSGRAVLRAEREVREEASTIPIVAGAPSSPAEFVPLERGDTLLYHVVADRYVASFLPMVGRFVPSLAIEPKDASGRPMAELDDAIIRTADGTELKVWRAVLDGAMSRDGSPIVADLATGYRGTQARLVRRSGLPLWIVPTGLFAALLVVGAWGVAAAIRRRRQWAPAR